MSQSIDINNIIPSLVKVLALQATLENDLSLVWTLDPLVQKRTHVKSEYDLSLLGAFAQKTGSVMETFDYNFYSSSLAVRNWTMEERTYAEEDISTWLSEDDEEKEKAKAAENYKMQLYRDKFYSSYSFFRWFTAKYKHKENEDTCRWLSEDEEDEDSIRTPTILPRWWTPKDTSEWHTYRSNITSLYSSNFRYWTLAEEYKAVENMSTWLANEKEEDIGTPTLSPTLLKNGWRIEDYISIRRSKFNSPSSFFRYWTTKEEKEAEELNQHL